MKQARSNGEVTEALRHAGAQLGQDLERAAQHARDALTELAEYSRGYADEKVNEAERAIQRSVRTRPIVWLGAAAGVGVIAGLLLMRRPGVR